MMAVRGAEDNYLRGEIHRGHPTPEVLQCYIVTFRICENFPKKYI